MHFFGPICSIQGNIGRQIFRFGEGGTGWRRGAGQKKMATGGWTGFRAPYPTKKIVISPKLKGSETLFGGVKGRKGRPGPFPGADLGERARDGRLLALHAVPLVQHHHVRAGVRQQGVAYRPRGGGVQRWAAQTKINKIIQIIKINK